MFIIQRNINKYLANYFMNNLISTCTMSLQLYLDNILEIFNLKLKEFHIDQLYHFLYNFIILM